MEYHEKAELLVMSALHILGKGASFRCCCTLTHISTSKVRKFFFDFLNANVDMTDEYISVSENVAALTCVMKCYESVGLPGACGPMDIVHVKWSNCPAGNYNRVKGSKGIRVLHSSASLTIIIAFFPSMVYSLGLEMIRK